MDQNRKIIDLLVVEETSQAITLFEEIAKIFNLSIKIGSSLDDFIEISTLYDFKVVLCNLHVEHSFAGLFLSRMYTNLRKLKPRDGKLFFYSFQHNPKLELAKLSLNDLSEEKFANFYDFLNEYFPEQFLHFFSPVSAKVYA